MYPEDRVLVVYVPTPADFVIAQQQGWYRIPQRYAPKGLYAEYFAFYFGQKFGQEKWAIHYFAPQVGYELVKRIALFPDEPAHPRAQEQYYKIQLGPLQKLKRPIISLRWRRITFIHTTWDRFQGATEINDLFADGGEYVDRLYATLKDQGIQAERNYRVQESGVQYTVPLSVVCQNGRINITHIPHTGPELAGLVAEIERKTAEKGGSILRIQSFRNHEHS